MWIVVDEYHNKIYDSIKEDFASLVNNNDSLWSDIASESLLNFFISFLAFHIFFGMAARPLLSNGTVITLQSHHNWVER